MWTVLPDGQVDFLNRQWCEFTGSGRRDRWQAAIHPDDLHVLLKGWRPVVASGEPAGIEVRLRRADGVYRWFLFRARPLVDAAGRVIKWCGLCTDIDERKCAEAAARVREGNYRSVADSIPAPIAFLTPTGDFESVNREVLDCFGLTLDDLRASGLVHAVHPDDLSAVVAAWQRSVDTTEPYDIEHRMRRADGVYRWFHVRALPLRDADGRMARWHCLLTDIDDRKRAEALLRGEKQLLEMVASGHSMSDVLEALCRHVESTATGCYCSVVLVDASGTRLEHGAAPSLPASFITSIIGRPVNLESGPCAMAAYLNEQVIATDLTSETRWAAYQWCPMALSHGLQACWSTPITSPAGKILGAFAIYYDEPSTPTPLQQSLIEQFMHLAGIAVERAQSDGALRRSEARKAAILDSALDCIVTIDHEGRITEFNPAAERTFGYRRDEAVGKALADVIIPPSLRDRHRQGFARYLAPATRGSSAGASR